MRAHFPSTALVLAAAAACLSARGTTGAPPPTPATGAAAMPGPMTPPPPQEFVAGPPVHPADELLRWLDSRSTGARGTLLKVPVVVVFDGPERLSIREAFIGASAADAGRDALALRLDDGAMGRALVDTLRERCPGSASTCALWLEGHWGSLVRAPADAARRTFSVRRVGALVAAEEARPLRVFVAGQ